MEVAKPNMSAASAARPVRHPPKTTDAKATYPRPAVI
jgi:hypothetical protein